MRSSPETTSTVLRYIEPRTVFAAEVELRIPGPDRRMTFLKLSGEKTWISEENAVDETKLVEKIPGT